MGAKQLAKLLCSSAERFLSSTGDADAAGPGDRDSAWDHVRASGTGVSDSIMAFCRSLTESERAQEECILLPLYHQLTREEQEFIASNLRAAVASECLA